MAQFIENWKKENPDDQFFFRPKTDNNHFLYVHQSPAQQRLLSRYGHELCLLDATYRTSRYALPLFFLVVPTNINYMVVASFILEHETKSDIAEALQILREWNPTWAPQNFLTDFSTEEIDAIESVFEGGFLTMLQNYALLIKYYIKSPNGPFSIVSQLHL